MRRLSMKNKHKKSETNENESDDNGVVSSDSQTGEEQRTKQLRERNNKKLHPDNTSEQQKEHEEKQENGNTTSKKLSNKRKKSDHKASTSAINEDKDLQYEVERIVSQRTIKGRRQYLIRWKGYDESYDTWEEEKGLNCSKLIEDYLADAENEIDSEQQEKSTKKPIKRMRISRQKESVNATSTNENPTEQEYEVLKILNVHYKKDKSKEFLIRWKGFSPNDDTWEPEENLNCSDLIEKFMQKVEKTKGSGARELRTNPTSTKRYIPIPAKGRRSRRNRYKERTTYHEWVE